jgi:catechol 2,3-dioxygenase-like lactoylglutathione lyase family enzyme
MINHVSIGVKDMTAARRFYDAALAPLGVRPLHKSAGAVGYGVSKAQFWVSAVPHPVPSDAQSGLHICFDAPTRKAVNEFHAAALKEGGRDNGRPGLRPEYGPNYYGGFVIDLDGYRIEAYCGAAE